MGEGARTLAPRAGVCMLVWALGAPPVARVAWMAPLRGASEVRRFPPPRLPSSGGLPDSATRALWARMRGRGGPALSPWLACSVGGRVLFGWWGAVPGGWPSTAARGVWCQALFLPLLPVLWGLDGQGSATRVSRGRLVWAWGLSTCPTACALAGRRCALWGWRKGLPRAGCLSLLREASELSRSPSPGFPSSGWAVGVRYRRAVGAGVRVWGPSTHCPLGLRALWGAACRRGAGRPSPVGAAFPRCEGRLLSGAVPPLASCPLGRAAGVPRSVCPGCCSCGRGDPAPVPQCALLRAAVARCGGGGKASPGGLPFAVERGV